MNIYVKFGIINCSDAQFLSEKSLIDMIIQFQIIKFEIKNCYFLEKKFMKDTYFF